MDGQVKISPKHSGLSPTELEELRFQAGSDPVLARMLERGIPLTRKVYLDMAWGNDLPEELGAEREMSIPPFLRDRHAS
jgi:hypothetical protein